MERMGKLMRKEDSWNLEIKFEMSGTVMHIKELKGSWLTGCLCILLLLFLYFSTLLIIRKG